MAPRWLGILVSSDKIVAVDAEVPKTGLLKLVADHSWSLQEGERATAYAIMHQQVSDYVSEHGIKRVVVKESAVSLGGTKKAHLQAAELRGIVIAAAASKTRTEVISKAHISRTFGSRKVDEYLSDSNFWTAELEGKSLRVGSREAAMVLLAARKEK